MKSTIRRLALLALFLALVVVVFLSSRSGMVKKETAPMLPDSVNLETPIPVVGRILEPEVFDRIITATGILAAKHRSMLSSESGGRVRRWTVEVGEPLGEGDVVLELDDELPELTLKQAEAGLESARIAVEKHRRDLERFKLLRDQGDMSRSDYEAAELGLKGAEAGFAAAEAAAGLARRNFNETKVKIPFEGKLTTKMVDAGQLIGPGTPVAEVVQVDPVCLVVSVGEEEVVQIKPGMEALVRTVGWRDRAFKGCVQSVAPAADIASRLFPVEIRVDNPHSTLIPGMAASVEILVKRYPNALSVPDNSIFSEEQGNSVFTVVASRAQRVSVEAGYASGLMTMINSGLEPGDTVIVVGQGSLKSGQRVTLSLDDAHP